MPVLALSGETQHRLLGSPMDILVEVLDADGEAVSDAAVTVTVTLPDGTTATPAPELIDGGQAYYAAHVITQVGRHVAVVTTDGYGSAAFAAYGTVPTANGDLPDVPEVDNYLRSGAGDHSWSADDMGDALRAETAAQARVCRIPPVYPDDLRQALLRRVQRNLAMRANTLGYVQGDGDVTVLPQNDPEVRRFERPHRKVIIG